MLGSHDLEPPDLKIQAEQEVAALAWAEFQDGAFWA